LVEVVDAMILGVSIFPQLKKEEGEALKLPFSREFRGN